MIEKICMVLIFVGVAVGVGIYCRRHTGSVDGFILGGRNVGPWLSAFAFGTSYFSAVIFVGYAGQFGWKYGVAATWIGIGNANPRQLAGLVGARPAHARDDASPGRVHDAEFFGERLPVEGFAHRGPRPSSSCSSSRTRPASTTACRVCSAWRSGCRTSGASSAWRLSPACTWCWAVTWPPS